MGAANETELHNVDQKMADIQTDHDMADVAVVEHSHLHEDEEHVEWEHPDKGISMKTMERLWILCRSELVSSARRRSWEHSVLVDRATVRRRERCGQHGGVTDGRVTQCEADLRSRQFREGTDPSVHAATPGPAAARIRLILSAIAATADFSVAFMHTPLTEEVFVEPPEEANLP